MKASERLLFLSQTDQFFHLSDAFPIFFRSDLIPGHAPPAVRVEPALHGDLRPVIDAGASRESKEHGKLLVELIEIMETVHQPFRVVRVQKICSAILKL